jgi:hypothetical protein
VSTAAAIAPKIVFEPPAVLPRLLSRAGRPKADRQLSADCVEKLGVALGLSLSL